ncbi:MAG: ATP-binding cassette domain-containing protein [Gammaproteobacteria bacterium]|jgi:putative ABC transport system ATP-binding protein|nr:ATP-binding cassette domain-containing protein [Gammaproteobacteria bacterium]
MADRMDSDAVLRAVGLAKEVSSPEGTLTILDGIDLDIARGESVALVGPSGAGKTTLLALLAGLDRPTRGKVWLCGTELTALDEDGRAALRAQRVGFVFQSFHLLQSLTALENVMLPLELAGEPKALAMARETLANIGLGARFGHYPRQLSGGEQQRVAIARAFVTRPEVLFADEPTGNLDSATGERIGQLLFDLNAEARTTLVMVTHQRELAERCDRTIQLVAGRIVT